MRIMILLVIASVATAAEPAKTHQVKLNNQTFTLPVGYEIELVAGPPLVMRPIHADFDERGFFYVTDSSGSNDPVEEQLVRKPHRIVRLQDTAGTGKFDKATLFADKMMFPEGALWKDGSLWVTAAPSIWKLTDTDGDGVADKRDEWFNGKTLTKAANDLHGPYAGPDGWIYWCKGGFAKQSYPQAGKPDFTTSVSHIYRARPDGSGQEHVMTGGMENPVGLCFTPGGERIFSATFLVQPGGGLRDGLAHAIYGGVYGRDHAGIREHPWTSPHFMPVMTHMGAAAPSGIRILESDALGFRGDLVCAQFNLHKVSRHVLTPDGATYKTVDSDLLVSDYFDFHPTDVLEDADGSLLVIDTGGWYKLACPSSQLAKPEITGGIYRIRKTSAAKIDDPRGVSIPWDTLNAEKLAALLGDGRHVVRKQAVERLVKLGEKAVPEVAYVLQSGKQPARVAAIWCVGRIDGAVAADALKASLTDGDETVRNAAIHLLGLRREKSAVSAIHEAIWLKPTTPMNKRAAIEAFGRLGDMSVLHQPLLDFRPDPIMMHALTYAFIEIANIKHMQAGLQSLAGERGKKLSTFPDDDQFLYRSMLTALDQLPGKNLNSDDVIRDFTSPDPKLREVAWWIAGRHPEWGDAVADVLREQMKKPTNDAELESRLAAFAGSAKVQAIIADAALDSQFAETRALAFRVMKSARLKQTPETWVTAVVARLNQNDDSWPVAVDAIRGLKLSSSQSKKLSAALLKVGEDSTAKTSRRLQALAAVPGGLSDVSKEVFELLMAALEHGADAAGRSSAVDIFSKSRLNPQRLKMLAWKLRTARPVEIDRLLDAFTQSKEREVGDTLLMALMESEYRMSLRADRLQPIFRNCDMEKTADVLIKMLNADLEKQKTKLEEMLPKLKDGDVTRGQVVYVNAKVQCTVCHAMGYQGGKIGPDLTHIGKIRTERDLLESILFPSASFVRSYEPVKVTLKNGATHNGVIGAETATEITLQLDAERQLRIARDEIDEITPSKTSIMPAGLDQQLSDRDLADLIAFLKSRQ